MRAPRAGCLFLFVAAAATVLAACSAPDPAASPGGVVATHAADDGPPDRATSPPRTSASTGPITVAFAGDMHFELQLAGLLAHPRGALGPITEALSDADLTMVNLESAIADPGRPPEAKELEVPDQRFHFRTSPAALRLLDVAGVDVVTMANNHGADYGPLGLQDTLAAIRHSPVPVVGVGRDRRAAFTPYRVSVRGTRFAFFAADASFREGSSSVWAAGPRNAGLAAAHAARPRALLDAVRRAGRRGDVVVVYLHWGEELRGCPTTQQRTTARALAQAGADVVVGSHAHVLLGSGWIGDTYVDYGLGNFLWYHDHQPETGVLRVTVRDGHVVGDSLVPARIQTDGRPLPLTGAARAAAIADWRRLRGCTGLAAAPRHASEPTGRHGVDGAAYHATIRRIGPRLRARMRYTHRSGCPVALADLRYLRMSYVGFDGSVHTGEMVVHERYAHGIVDVFHRLFDARWPIRRMRLVDDYRGDDDRSMAADNTSGYNCRRVAGTSTLSAHAYGAAVDLDPAQNPYVTPSGIHPAGSARFALVDRSADAPVPPGVIREGDVVVRAFARIGWEWGGRWAGPKDYQHFAAVAG